MLIRKPVATAGRLINQPQVSKHLRVLKEAGPVDVQPRAQQRLYELRAQPLRQLHNWLERYRRLWDARFEQMDPLIEELKERRSSMVARKESEVAPLNQTSMELKGDREIVIAHTFNAPGRIVFDAWTKA